MSNYTIDQFSKITGFSKFSLRTWENRYGFLKPKRTPTKIRLYSDEHLIKGLNSNYLLQNGYKISRVASLSKQEIIAEVEKIGITKSAKNKELYYITKLIKSAINFDNDLFNATFNLGLDNFSVIEFYQTVILPTFNKIGVLWLTERINPAQEHFLSENVKQKLYSKINDQMQDKYKDTWLLFLPEHELHDMGLIIAKLILCNLGYNVIYLGSNVPLTAIEKIPELKKIDKVLYFKIANIKKDMLTKMIKKIELVFKDASIYLSTRYYGEEVSRVSNTNIIYHFKDFFKILDESVEA